MCQSNIFDQKTQIIEQNALIDYYFHRQLFVDAFQAVR